VRVDGAFEAALGITLIAGLGADDFPDPVGKPVVVAFGVGLLAVGAVLWRLAGTIDLRVLAAANVVTAALAVTWYAAASGFSSAGAALTLATAAALVLLAAAQLLGSRS
jgi:hypothetical protein